MRSITNNGLGNVRTFFCKRTSGAVESKLNYLDHTNLDQTTKLKEYEAPRGQPQNMSGEAHFLASRRLTSWRARVSLQTASLEAVNPHFCLTFQAATEETDI